MATHKGNPTTGVINPLVTADDVEQRDIWWARFPQPDGKVRPCLVVSTDTINAHYPDVLVVPLTSRINPERLRGQVLIRAEDSWLDRDSVTKVNRLQSLDRRTELIEWVSCIGHETFAQVQTCIRQSLGLEEK